MLQRGRLPLQQLFNNNNRKQHLAPTNNFQPGSTNNNQFPTSINNRMSSIQNYRSQILKNSQQTFSSRRGLGEQSLISTGNKCHHWWDPPFQHHWFASLSLYYILYHWFASFLGNQKTPALLANRDLHKRLQKQGFSTFTSRWYFSWIIAMWFSYLKNIPLLASSYNSEKDHFTKTIFVSTSTTKVMLCYLEKIEKLKTVPAANRLVSWGPGLWGRRSGRWGSNSENVRMNI